MSGAAGDGDRGYGQAAVVLGALLLWFSVWTLCVNALVLAGVHYPLVVWCVPFATIVTALALAGTARRVAAGYATAAASPDAAAPAATGTAGQVALLLGLAALFAAAVQVSRSLALLVAGAALIGWLCLRLQVAPAGAARQQPPPRLWRDIAILTLLLAALYYFGHRPDWDDANYINLAAGAQRTAGDVFQLDTMLGDGPGPIHLPTYKLHSFELLGAAISTLTGLSPIAALQLAMPLPQIVFIAVAFALILRPVAGRHWPAAAVFALAFLAANTETLGSWGLHGIIRLFQGKGLLITAIVPLVVALTGRWLLRGQRIDLVALALCHVSAIGLSANGLYLTPAASGLTAIAFLATGRALAWRRLFWLIPTLAYPVLISAVVALRHLALPSEVTGATDPYQLFRFVIGWRIAGLAALALLPLAPIAFSDPRLRRVGAAFLPLAVLLIVNPLGWKVAAAITGNLGFRLFWAIPAALAIGLVCAALVRRVAGDRPGIALAVAGAALLLGIGYNARFVAPDLRVAWHRPGLKVVPRDYADAQALVALAPAGCTMLVPERVAVWVAGLPGAPYPAFVRSLYLQHYRFTMPAAALRTRWALFDLEAGKAAPLPSPAALAADGIRIGFVAIDETAPTAASAARLARALGLDDHGRRNDGLVYWRGACRPINAGERK